MTFTTITNRGLNVLFKNGKEIIGKGIRINYLKDRKSQIQLSVDIVDDSGKAIAAIVSPYFMSEGETLTITDIHKVFEVTITK